MASGVIASDPVIIATARPGASLVSTPRVAWINTRVLFTLHFSLGTAWNILHTSGVTSLLANPVPPVVRIRLSLRSSLHFLSTSCRRKTFGLKPFYCKGDITTTVPVYPAHCLEHRLSQCLRLLYSGCSFQTNGATRSILRTLQSSSHLPLAEQALQLRSTLILGLSLVATVTDCGAVDYSCRSMHLSTHQYTCKYSGSHLPTQVVRQTRA